MASLSQLGYMAGMAQGRATGLNQERDRMFRAALQNSQQAEAMKRMQLQLQASEQARQAAMQEAATERQWRSGEAEKSRTAAFDAQAFEAAQQGIKRDYASIEAEKERAFRAGRDDQVQAFNAQQAALDRQFRMNQAQAERQFTSQQANLDRQFSATEAEKGRRSALGSLRGRRGGGAEVVGADPGQSLGGQGVNSQLWAKARNIAQAEEQSKRSQRRGIFGGVRQNQPVGDDDIFRIYSRLQAAQRGTHIEGGGASAASIAARDENRARMRQLDLAEQQMRDNRSKPIIPRIASRGRTTSGSGGGGSTKNPVQSSYLKAFENMLKTPEYIMGTPEEKRKMEGELKQTYARLAGVGPGETYAPPKVLGRKKDKKITLTDEEMMQRNVANEVYRPEQTTPTTPTPQRPATTQEVLSEASPKIFGFDVKTIERMAKTPQGRAAIRFAADDPVTRAGRAVDASLPALKKLAQSKDGRKALRFMADDPMTRFGRMANNVLKMFR